jgi:hypothetical protein
MARSSGLKARTMGKGVSVVAYTAIATERHNVDESL